MDINIAIQQFQVLVNDFANHKDFTVEGNKIFKEKQKNLINFSQSINSLPVCLFTLQNSTDATALYFASQFIKDKLKFQFQQLSKDAVVQTHTKIINVIRTKTNMTKIITSNLALSLSFLYIHCYDQLGTALEFIEKTFTTGTVNPLSRNLYFQYLFRYLDGLACEIDSKRLVIDEMKRAQVLKAFQKQQTQILLALHKYYSQLSSKQSTIKLSMSDMENILFSFSQWLRIDPPQKQIVQEIHNHSVFRFAIASLSDQELSEPATQCLMAIMEAVVSPDHNPTFYQQMGNHLQYFFKSIDRKINEQEFDQAENYVRVLSEYGMGAAKALIEQFGPIPQLFIEKMVKYTANPLMQVFSELVDFWQTIIYFISNRSENSSLDQQNAQRIISTLYQVFTDKIRYNTTQVHELDQLSERQLAKLHQSIDDVRERRECSRWIFQSIAKFIGHDGYVKSVLATCKTVDPQGENYWGRIQSYIYSLRDVVKNCVEPTPELCELVVFFQTLKENHMIVMKSILRVYGSLQTMQTKNEEFIVRILGHTIKMFKQPQLAEKAGETFVKCCEQNASVLVKHISSIYSLLNQFPDRDSVLVGLTFILKIYPDLLTSHLPQIIKGPIERLKKSHSKKQKRNQFNKLFTIIECIPKGQTKNISGIIETLMTQMWPIVSQILQQPEEAETDQDRLIERAVKFLKLVMRSIPEKFVQFLNQIFVVVMQAYRKYPINSYIYLFQVTFTVYQKSTNEQILLFLKNLYQQYCGITYQHLGTEAALINYQHLVDDFIGLNKRIVTFNTKVFLESGQVRPIMEFSIHCLGSSIPRVASSASQLFEIIFMIYWSAYSRQKYENEAKGEVVAYDSKNVVLYNELKQFILPSVPNLLRQMFKFLQTGPVESARSNIIDCLEAIALAFPKESAQLWAQPLSQLAEDIITSKQRQRLKQKILLLSSQNHLQFVNAQHTVNKLLLTISSRYLYRKSRAEDLIRG